jgi:aldehyde dehydrogenase (NAD+)
VVAVAKFSTEEELVQLANNSSFGLAAAIFSRDISRALIVANKLEAGTVWINSHSMIEVNVPFGGFKRTCVPVVHLSPAFLIFFVPCYDLESGTGREYGEDALKEYLEIKAVHVNLTAPPPI